MTFICDYAKVSPAVLEMMVEKATSRLFCNWWEETEDSFVFRVFALDDEGITAEEQKVICEIVEPKLFKDF
jgi:hypothetical protein